MVGSGIGVSDACATEFKDLKTGKQSRFLVFAINNDVVEVAFKGPRTATYDDFLSKVGKDTPCYAVYDFEFDVDGGKRDKLLFISWIPDIAKVRPKMIYASTKESVKAKIGDGLLEIQATDASEISYEAVLAKAKASVKA
jgi:cofilin